MKNPYATKRVYADGQISYFDEKGLTHRTDGPAIEFADGSKWWYIHEIRHRIGGPAIEQTNGIKQWFVNGQIHRIDGPAIEYANGDFKWYVNSYCLCDSQIAKLQELRKTFNDDDLLNMLLLSGRIIL